RQGKKPAMLRTVLLSMSLSLACAGTAQADPDMMRPFGMSAGGYEDPFYAPSRDNSGVRVVVNGRAVDLQERSGGYSAAYPMRGGVSGGPTLRGPTLSAMAIGNSVAVSNTSNSTIFVNAVNAGNQYAVMKPGRN
ncbi:MAG: hypothetical protein ACOYMK_17925, partial [Hyphomonadaceae bacterium]